VTVDQLNEDEVAFYVSIPGCVVKLQDMMTMANYSTPGMTHPTGVAIDKAGGYLYTADQDNDRIIQFDLNSTSVVGIWTHVVSSPQGIALTSSGQLVVVDRGNSRVVSLTSKGTIARIYQTSNPSLSSPSGVAVNVFDGSDDVWVVDTGNNRVVGFAGNTSQIINIIPPLLPPSPFAWINPTGIGISQSGWVYLVDSGNNMILGYSYPNTKPQLGFYYAGITPTTNYSNPTGVFLTDGTMAVADTNANVLAYYLYCEQTRVETPALAITA